MKFTTLAAAAALIAVSTPAFARQWWMLDFNDQVCKKPPALLSSPQKVRETLKEAGRFEDVKVGHNDAGSTVVVITFKTESGDDELLAFFTDPNDCSKILTALKENGTLPDLSALQ